MDNRTDSAAPSGRVDIENLAISFELPGGDTLEAVSDVDIVLEAGSFTALIGPSGCGKSTILNAVAGFVPISGGQIKIDNEPVSGINPEVGVVFQQYALFPWFTAIGNVEFALKRLQLPRAERRERALAALREVGLEDRASTYPGQLSGGMKQRVALARTFASEPKVLLMDEPFGALDAQTRIAMHELLLGVWDLHRTTVLFVTHDVDEALLLSDRAHIMSTGPGRIIESLEVTSSRPRKVDEMTEEFLTNRNKIMKLLRHHTVAES
ncbi:MAG: ATP-binding cassette domain-containing protein [Alphaproteobacteria bacterium]|nr:ATP-binding cassette domain-containing protein [Alphaproteobacteria bacterium]